MSEYMVQYGLFLLFALAYSLYWGKAMSLCINSKWLNSFVRFLMRYSRSQFDPIKLYTMMIFYFVISLLGSGILLTSFNLNIFQYFVLESRYIVYIFIGFVAQISLSSMILLVISSIKKVDWFAVVRDIPWVHVMSYLPKTVRPVYPALAATGEELFFRGTVFMIHLLYFPELGIILPVVVTTLLFILHQILTTSTVIQGVVITVGAIVVSVIGCLLIVFTGSFLPALVCHLLFVFFYLGPQKEQHKEMKKAW